MRAREGDFIETQEGLIFDVKGHWHPSNRITAFLRYIPHPRGDRKRAGKRYKKVYDMWERQKFLKAHFPEYLFRDKDMGPIQAVPEDDVARIYRPQEFLAALDRKKRNVFEDASLSFCRILSETADVPLSHLGISGSALVGLAGARSDIDLVAYGKREGRSVHAALGTLRKRNVARPLSGRHLSGVCLSRWMRADGETKRREAQKLLHGLFSGIPYFVRLVRREKRERVGRAWVGRIEGTVVGAGDSVFTPCIYEVESGQVQRLYSVRGRYCEHLRRGEGFSVTAKIERVETGERRAVLSGERISITPGEYGKPLKATVD